MVILYPIVRMASVEGVEMSARVNSESGSVQNENRAPETGPTSSMSSSAGTKVPAKRAS